jgi:putative Mg2+ transporter-C (MgtC) family protein
MDFCINLLTAAILGTLIGLERQWRQGFAGLRTNALVAAGAAAFVGASLSQASAGSPAPMLGQIISGIGFLGAGVIFKEDFNVRGLNTAATIWCSAAVGMLAGLGMMPQALATALTVIALNLALRPIVRKLSMMNHGPGTESQTIYCFHLICTRKNEARLRSLLIQAASASHLAFKNLHSEKNGVDRVHVSAEMTLLSRDDHSIEEVAGRVSSDRAVISLRWELIKSDYNPE